MVDYVGIGHHLKKAIDTYDEREQKEIIDALSFPGGGTAGTAGQPCRDHGPAEEARPDGPDRSRCLLRCVLRRGPALRLHAGVQEAHQVPEPGLFPAKEALRFHGATTRRLTEINVLAGKHFRDERLSMKGIPPKLRAITDEYLESKGIDQSRSKPISILDEDFEKACRQAQPHQDQGGRGRARHPPPSGRRPGRRPGPAGLLCRGVGADLRGVPRQLEQDLRGTGEAAERIISASKEPTYGLHRKKQMPFFRMFKREIFGCETKEAVESRCE